MYLGLNKTKTKVKKTTRGGFMVVVVLGNVLDCFSARCSDFESYH